LIWKWLIGIWISVVIVIAFVWAPEAMRPNHAAGTVDPWPSFRIVFFHVPAAWVSVLAFAVSMVASVVALRGYSGRRDDLAAGSAELGFLFCALTLVTGMMWARVDWGAFWNWDPRQTSVLILLLIYAGYFALRGSVPDPERRARLAAVYSIVAFVTVPFLVFVVPRIMFTLHPSPIIQTGSDGGSMDPKMRTVFFLALAGFTGLYVWMLKLRVQLETLRREVFAR
jgi:heme exporter protein C